MGFGGNMATDINTALGYTRKDLSHCMEHGPQVATHATHNSSMPPSQAAKLKDTTKISKGPSRGTECIHPQESQISSLPGAATETTDANMASSGIQTMVSFKEVQSRTFHHPRLPSLARARPILRLSLCR